MGGAATSGRSADDTATDGRSVRDTADDTDDGHAARVLDGTWLVRAAGPGEWRTVADRALDESGWQATSSPGRWWLDAGLAGEHAVLYRRHFELPADVASLVEATSQRGARWWLVAGGLCELGHLWLDGAYLGDLRGRHAEHAFEVDALLRTGIEHLAAVEAGHGAVRVPQQENADMRIQRTGPARIERVRALVIEASPDRAVLRITATVDSAGTHRGELTTTVLPVASRSSDASDGRARAGVHSKAVRDTDAGARASGTSALCPRQRAVLGDGLAESVQILARGRNELEWLVALEQPSLWWPAGMGAQDLYCITVTVAVDGQPSDIVRLPIGVRTVAIRRGRLVVNREQHPDGLGATETVEHQVDHRNAYAAANARGAVICQQISLDPGVFAGDDRSRRALAGRAAAAAADQAGHHPSIVAWQPMGISAGPARKPWRSPTARSIMRKAMRAADPTRPTYWHSRTSS